MVTLPLEPSVPKTNYQERLARTKKYRDKIHRESKAADMKNLPFTFSKPKRPKFKPDECVCEKCGRISSINKRTCVLLVCPCGHVNYLDRYED